MMDLQYHIDYLGFSDPDKDMSILYNDNGSIRGSLFHEINRSEDMPPLYTMRERPFKGLPSAYLIYMYSDTEYEAAMKLFGSWTIWERYCSNDKFMNGPKNSALWTGLAKWRQEKKIQDEARAFSQLREAADTGSVQAMKAIWDHHHKPKRGRPSQAEIDKAAKEEAAIAQKSKEDLKRIRLVASNGQNQ